MRLTYLDAGSVFIQLVEPLDDESPIAAHLAEHGEGLHHIAFAVEDVPGTAAELADRGAPAGHPRQRPRASRRPSCPATRTTECGSRSPASIAQPT